MTAINIVIKSDAIHVLTDGGAYDVDGILLEQFQKAVALTHLNAVIAVRGPRQIGLVLRGLLESSLSFDHLKTSISERLEAACTPALPQWERSFGAFGTKFDLFVCGFSETQGANGCVVSSYNRDGVPPWQSVELGALTITPGTQEIYSALPTPDLFDPKVDGIRLLEMQRAEPVKVPWSSKPQHIVGGFVQLTTIEKNRISSEVIHRWQDAIGKCMEV
jgi:hypothetical protein